MKEKTIELLQKCKEAGYEKVAIFVRDEAVPRTMTIESGAWFGDQSQPKDLPNTPIRVVCGYPERIGKHFRHSGDAWPLMWSIVHELGLTAGMPMGGSGMGDAHNISNVLMDTLDAGVYDLKDEIK